MHINYLESDGFSGKECLLCSGFPIVGWMLFKCVGPGCSDAAEPIAALTGHFHTLMVSYGAEASSLADRAKYPYFFRTIPQVNHYR